MARPSTLGSLSRALAMFSDGRREQTQENAVLTQNAERQAALDEDRAEQSRMNQALRMLQAQTISEQQTTRREQGEQAAQSAQAQATAQAAAHDALAALAGGYTPEKEAAALRAGVDPRSIEPYRPKGPSAPIPGTPEHYAMLTAQERARAAGRPAPRSSGQGGAPKQRPLPASTIEKLSGLDNIASMATEVRDALTNAIRTNTNVTGRVGGVISTPTWAKNLVGMGGDTGTDVRAMVGNLYATLAKERGGTALSANELRLLESYLPNENEPETAALIKANRFIREIGRLKKSKVEAFQKYGGYTFDDDAPQMDRPYDLPNTPDED